MSQLATRELSIPEFVKQGLVRLADLSEDAAKELLAALKEEGPAFSSGVISQHVASKVQEVEERDINYLVQTLLSMYRARQEYGMPPGSFEESIAANVESFGVTDEQSERLRARLPEFLEIESLLVTAKALDILGSHERLLLRSQILTDMRPIFGNDESGQPKAAVLVHMLKLTYKQDEEDKDFFIAMDTEDVRKLKDVLERADKKAAGLQALLGTAEIPYLEVSSEVTKN